MRGEKIIPRKVVTTFYAKEISNTLGPKVQGYNSKAEQYIFLNETDEEL